ncbi:MAG: hypothetical protein IKD66_02740 [Solobacterium sp.]|nr:hypothetical protein [Solobacterium sp.]
MMKKMICLFAGFLLLAGCSAPAASAAPTPAPGGSYAVEEPAGIVSAIVGKWKLDKVEGTMRGESEKHEFSPEENASVYGDLGNIYDYREDGTAVTIMSEAKEQYEQKGTWAKNEDGSFAVTFGEVVFTYVYNSEDDSLHRTFEASSQSDRYTLLEFIYRRAE